MDPPMRSSPPQSRKGERGWKQSRMRRRQSRSDCEVEACHLWLNLDWQTILDHRRRESLCERSLCQRVKRIESCGTGLGWSWRDWRAPTSLWEVGGQRIEPVTSQAWYRLRPLLVMLMIEIECGGKFVYHGDGGRVFGRWSKDIRSLWRSRYALSQLQEKNRLQEQGPEDGLTSLNLFSARKSHAHKERHD